MSTENGPKSVATEGPKNQENPKPWKKRTKIIPRGGPKHQTQDEEEKFTGNSQEILGKPPGYSQRIQDRSAKQTVNPLINEASKDKQQRQKQTRKFHAPFLSPGDETVVEWSGVKKTTTLVRRPPLLISLDGGKP